MKRFVLLVVLAVVLMSSSALAEEEDPIFSASPAAGITSAGSGEVITAEERERLSGSTEGGFGQDGKAVLLDEEGKVEAPIADESISGITSQIYDVMQTLPSVIDQNPNEYAPCLTGGVGKDRLAQAFDGGLVIWLCAKADSEPEEQDGRWTAMNETLLVSFGSSASAPAGNDYCLLYSGGSSAPVACSSSFSNAGAFAAARWIVPLDSVVTRVSIRSTFAGASGSNCDIRILRSCTLGGGCGGGDLVEEFNDVSVNNGIFVEEFKRALPEYEIAKGEDLFIQVVGCTSASNFRPIVELWGAAF